MYACMHVCVYVSSTTSIAYCSTLYRREPESTQSLDMHILVHIYTHTLYTQKPLKAKPSRAKQSDFFHFDTFINIYRHILVYTKAKQSKAKQSDFVHSGPNMGLY